MTNSPVTTEPRPVIRVTPEDLSAAHEALSAIAEAFGIKVVGQGRLRTALLVTLLSRGHILLESVPGLAKTLAAATLARSVQGSFARIQCTPDLLPSDIIGTQVYDPRNHVFETQLGPVHANFVLLDEVNRASAKTQSAMLEAMQERQTSIAGVKHALPTPFMVLATQNPIEEEGTYVLPHAQLDRFLLKEVVEYPTQDEELVVLDRIGDGSLTDEMGFAAVATIEQVNRLQAVTNKIYVDPVIKRYIVALVDATRHVSKVCGPDIGRYVELGASPRGSIALFQVARALAVLNGRDHVIPEDVRYFRHSVLRHRIQLTFEALAERVEPEVVIDAIYGAVPCP